MALRHGWFSALALSAWLMGCGDAVNTTVGDPDAATGASDAAADAQSAANDVASPSGYTEALCDDAASLDDLAAAYANTPEGLRAAVRGIAERRYPIGVAFVDVQSDAQLQGWFRSRTRFSDVLNGFEVAVHEGQHIWDITMISGTWPYRVRDDLVIRPRRLSNFNRSEILTLHANPDADSYDEVYLRGQSGAQGFNTLLDEYVAYTHSLAARYCTRDGLASGTRISARDGILTLMYYVELYLKLARTQHADDYEEIINDPAHVELIRTVWARAEFWLERSAPYPQLGLRDAQIRQWTYAPENVMEIEMLPR
ncbi:MAG: hypothetical protein R3A52_31160 [Polyangiales bacterium]